MNNTYTSIEQKIKDRFQLFVGKRPHKEDQEIWEKVFDLCFAELIAFLEDNLNESQKKSFTGKLDALAAKGLSQDKHQDAAINLILKYLTQIPNHRFKLDKRLNYFLNNLVYSSLKT